MRSCDTNILAYYFDERSSGHSAAKRYLEECADDRRFVLCDLVLAELYVLLRNPVLFERPCSGVEAEEKIREFTSNPSWEIVYYPGRTAMDVVWRDVAREGIGRQAIYDARLARTLRHHGVREFATRNVKDFERFGFERVFNPIDEA